MPNIRRRLRVQHPPPWAGSQQLNLCPFGIARGGVRAGGGAVAVCSAVSPATKNEQMMTEGEDLQFQDRPATELAGKSETMERTSLSIPATLGRPLPNL